MRINIVTTGNKMPGWVSDTCNDYLRRLPRDFRVGFIEIPLEKRGKNYSTNKVRQQETCRLLEAVPRGDHVISLDERGKSISTQKLANSISDWQMSGRNISLLVGGPDGLDFSATAAPAESWSLSPLTFPHPLVRVILAEQLYRAWSLNAGHPYHRDG